MKETHQQVADESATIDPADVTFQPSVGPITVVSTPQTLGHPLCPLCKGVGAINSGTYKDPVPEPCEVCETHSNMVEHDGFILDGDTGEILGVAVSVILPFERDNLVEWALKKRAEALAECAGLEAQMNSLLSRIRESHESRINAAKRKAEYLENAYGSTIRNWLEDNLQPGKKSAKHTWATVGYKTSRESCKVIDESAAVAYCEEHYPEAVKIVKSVLTSNIPADQKPKLPESAFEFHAAGETQQFYID